MTNTTTVVDMRKFVEARDGRAFTTSQQVAQAFGKQHYHVLAKVRELECSDQFLTHNFSWVQFEHRGNQYEAVEMTKDGFVFLVMGFTGAKAAAVKEGYIHAFNAMAEQLNIKSDVLVGDLVGAVIGSSGEVVLDRVIDQKATALPVTLRRSFKHTMKSRLRTRFNVQKTALIPAEELANACNFVAAYVFEGELLPQREPIQIVGEPHKRYLLAFDHKGQQSIEEISEGAFILSKRELMEGMVATPGDIPVSIPEMFQFLMAAVVNLKSRYEYMAKRSGK
ncbi:phage regulatory protein [Pseudomonas plecoglossicida]|uniref:Rha family transcriptional regulator n=1 Tax=Pseudomonas TaxID=286 RepID=UPI0002A167CE|nr:MULTISPECIES: Rha family transcriptional regulator [Pseudomonas]AGA72985.1 prophage antirepressor [Pseudomonas putida HB3267]MCE0946199.1 Rha family transcriptional regulator [Pseudomonas asiatica]MCE1067184.1 Rha family transcriptional regulator [Pseudomonas asiatica]MCE1101983.1 Rha family transcriptional regulator [Pseudomonas asiatica]MCE1107517.1 Rha family transcriptional regulator [Pseudomonas asiatica]